MKEGTFDEKREGQEKGKNVLIRLKFIRHGERTKAGELTDYGRQVTAERALQSGITGDDFDAVKAIGSDAGESAGVGKRAFETADIYAHTIAGEEAFNSRIEKALSFETLKNPVPYNHVEIYNENLPANFEELGDEEKANAAKVAQAAGMTHLINMKQPEAVAYKREMAGAFAYLVEHYKKMAERLNSDSKVLMPAGTHGGVMEFLLQECLIKKDEEGNVTAGFEQASEIGGEFSPSDSYNVDIETDENGEFKKLVVSFDDPNRNQGFTDLYLDEDKVKELSTYYHSLHKEDN